VALRRNVAGTVVDLQVDAVSVTSGVLSAPQTATVAKGCIGITQYDSGAGHYNTINGGIGECGFWNSRLTDAQIADVRARVMGL
jgi:hypothetical protein